MSDSKLSKKEQEELNRLEEEAFKELGQIIAIAYQVQDIQYINNLILAWERKYQKLLSNPDFKKKFKKILDETYDELVRYILSKIKLKEEKEIKNQRKALHELYNIIKDNYDLDILKNKIKNWETKYPYNSFLKMYQKRIDSAKKEKNLQDNAFKQEEAFKDLYYGVVNRSGTIKELKEYLAKWENKYSINNKFTIDKFIKHQSEVKRYTSNEFLISIAKKEDNILDNHVPQTTSSSLSVQSAAYKHLKSLLSSKDNLADVFKWVYKNHSIKFNDKYKELILSAIYLDYSPKYLKTLMIPNIDLTQSSLPLEQYSKIEEIQKYAIISYFNLLLPSNEAVKNVHFVNDIKSLYLKLEKFRNSNIINSFDDEVTNFIPKSPKEENKTISEVTTNSTIDTDLSIDSNILDIEQLIEGANTIELITPPISKKSLKEDSSLEEHTTSGIRIEPAETIPLETSTSGPIEITVEEKNNTTVSILELEPQENTNTISDSNFNSDISTTITKEKTIEVSNETIDSDIILSVSPVFFETINNYTIQASLIETATHKLSKSNETISFDISNTKTRNQSD